MRTIERKVLLTWVPLDENNFVGLFTLKASPMSLRTFSKDPSDRRLRKTRPLFQMVQKWLVNLVIDNQLI